MSAETFVASPAAGIRARRRGVMRLVLRAAAIGSTCSAPAQWPAADPIPFVWMLRHRCPDLPRSQLRVALPITTGRLAVCSSQTDFRFPSVRSSWGEEEERGGSGSYC